MSQANPSGSAYHRLSTIAYRGLRQTSDSLWQIGSLVILQAE
jgi:hypothetical protein